jgi:hypothetical protein
MICKPSSLCSPFDPASDSFLCPAGQHLQSLFVFSSARLEEDQLPQQPSLPDPLAMHG